MESSGLLDCAVRVKEEPCDVSLSENNCDMIDEKPDLKNFQQLPLPRESFRQTLQKCNENHTSEFDNEMKIVFECEDVKPNVNSLVVKKIDDDFQYQLQDMKYSDSFNPPNIMKIEPMGVVKQEIIDNVAVESNLNSEEELAEQNEERRVTTKFNDEHNLKTHIYSVHNNVKSACEICGKNLSSKKGLQRHINAIHNGVKHACDKCGKKLSSVENLKRHVDSIHSKITHKCDVCGKSFSFKQYLQIHIKAVHIGVTHACDICGKKFSMKTYLKIHINAVHNGVRYTCNVCEKTYRQKEQLKKHIDEIHNGVRYTCKNCGKMFKSKRSLRYHDSRCITHESLLDEHMQFKIHVRK